MDKSNTYRLKIEQLRNDISESCRKSNRDPGSVTLIAASKYADAKQIEDVIGSGSITDFGENRADEFSEKYCKLGCLALKVRWHFIGHLQSRKAKAVVPLAEYIHSIDSISTIEAVNKAAFKEGKIQKVLIEVNISGEETKYGIKPDEAEYFIRNILDYKNIMACGLMTMAPLTSDETLIRKVFRCTRSLRDSIIKNPGFEGITELSMGMSNDFRIAVEEGSTMVRIGSLIFL
ncbi:MAG: hypothetical protein BWY60_00938 [Actinobacteria bacterium ADurb.Bin346]|nr:MAG: hypothetical protein BWY60_00938 [Actinobacteria bacterium ADurb.Bin346]